MRVTRGRLTAARPGAADQPVAQLAGVPAADRQLGRRRGARVQRPPSTRTSSTWREGDQVDAVDADEAGVAPALLQGRQRDPHQVAAVAVCSRA